MGLRVLVCGDRNWSDRELICEYLKCLNPSVVIEGEAKGADSLGRDCARELGITVAQYPADWEKYGRAAGPIRNIQMIDSAHPDLVLAFHDDISVSKGTKHCMEYAKRKGIKVVLVTHLGKNKSQK